jgi:sigma-B regulation protein RsbU (phosphoserine phosphatase)
VSQHEEILKQDLFPIDGLASGARLVRIDTNEQEPLTGLAVRMREKLNANHVICPELRARELCQALRQRHSTVRAVLEIGFYALLTIEVSRGVDSHGRFDHDGLFLPYLRDVLYESFGIESTDDFHPEQIAQVAKDEPRSLFCFLDAQYIPAPEIQRLRIFTQSHHRVLLCAIALTTGQPRRSPSNQNNASELRNTLGNHPLGNVGMQSGTGFPVLVRVNGEAAGQIIELKRERLLIGRSVEHCQILLAPMTVGHKHAEIYRKGDEFYLADLNSRIPGIDHRLAPGDRIRICGAELLYNFAIHRDAPFVSLTRTDDLEFEMESDPIPQPVDREVERRAILKIARNLSSELKVDAVAPKILESLTELFPQAESCLMVLVDPETGRLARTAFKYQPTRSPSVSTVGPADDVAMSISRSILKYVFGRHRAVLRREAISDQNPSSSASIAGPNVRTVMCVPLLTPNCEALGVIQVATSDRQQFHQRDLDVLSTVASQAAIAVQNAAIHESLLEGDPLQCDLKLAEQIRRLVPQSVPVVPGFEFFTHYNPAYEVHGDYYDFVRLSSDRFAVAVGDVSSVGVGAALMIAKLWCNTRYCIFTENSPASAANELNKLMYSAGVEEKWINLSLSVLDVPARTLTLTSAGNLPVMIRRADGTVDEIGKEFSGFPLGIIAQPDYKQTVVRLSRGDVVVVLSDDVIYARNLREEFSESRENRRLLSKVAETPGPPRALGGAILEDIREFSSGRAMGDDMTLICFGPI